jgi:transcriptional regulator with XRE-family HTH domain
MSSIGMFLRDRRIALGLSQEALAEAAGVSARSINRWEQGRALPQPEVRRRLAEVLGIDVAAFAVAVRSTAVDGTAEFPTVWHVPLRRNPFFTGRDVLLQELHSAK